MGEDEGFDFQKGGCQFLNWQLGLLQNTPMKKTTSTIPKGLGLTVIRN